MVVVAVVGGTGAANPLKAEAIGVRTIETDYKDVPAIRKILGDNNVHMVVSALIMMPDTAGPLEPNLILAADSSQAPSQPIVWSQASSDSHSAKKWTVIHIGYFMDYLGMPKLPSYLAPHVMLINRAENAASIPGDGNTPVTFTHSSDVGKFVAAIVDLDKWDPTSVIVGDKITLNEAVKLAEVAKGTKFKVIYDDIDKLKKGRLTELPSQAQLYGALPAGFLPLGSRFGVCVARGDLDLDGTRL